MRVANQNLSIQSTSESYPKVKTFLPQYIDTWDVEVVLNYLISLFPMYRLSLKDLTLETCMLLALVTGKRGHTLHSLCVNDVKLSGNKCFKGFPQNYNYQTRVSPRTSRNLRI